MFHLNVKVGGWVASFLIINNRLASYVGLSVVRRQKNDELSEDRKIMEKKTVKTNEISLQINLKSLQIFIIKVRQKWLMTFCPGNYFNTYSNENLPYNTAKVDSKFCQILCLPQKSQKTSALCKNFAKTRHTGTRPLLSYALEDERAIRGIFFFIFGFSIQLTVCR